MKPGNCKSLIGVALTLGLITTNCSFLLDFDKFETRAECAQCADVEPCDASQWCVSNECLDDPSDLPECQEPAPHVFKRCGAFTSDDAGNSVGPKLVTGHRLADLSADTIGKTQILVGANFVYHVAYVEEAGKPDIVLRAFPLNKLDAEPNAAETLSATQTLRISEFLEDESVRSPASITLDGDNHVVLYVAQGSANRDVQSATLSRMVLREDLTSPSSLKRLTDPANYRVSDDFARVGPEAGYLDNGEAFVAWQGCKAEKLELDAREDLCKAVASSGGSAIFTHTGDDELELQDLEARGVAEPLAISALQTLSDGAQPAAVWGTTTTEHEVSITTAAPDVPTSLRLFQCDDRPGYVLNSLRAAPTHNGISSIVWSKRLAGEASITEASSAGCGDECLEDYVSPVDGAAGVCGKALYQRRVFPSVRAAAHGVWLVDPEDPEQAVIVSAKLEELGDETRLTLAQDLGSPNPNESPFLDQQGDELTLAEGSPAWPELHLQTRRHQKVGAAYTVVGVGWVEEAGDEEVAKLQTYDLCFEQ